MDVMSEVVFIILLRWPGILLVGVVIPMASSPEVERNTFSH